MDPVQRPKTTTPTDRRKRAWAVGSLTSLLVVGLALSQASPSLRAAVVESGQRAARDAEAILAARSPGDRLAGAFLTKVKEALSSDSADDSHGDLGNAPREVTRSRMIPPRTSEGESAPDLILLNIPELLAPLDGLGETATGPLFTSLSLPAAFPIILLGDAGGSGGSGGGGQGGGSGGGGGAPTSEVPLVITPGATASSTPEPSSPVPEPSTWLSMLVGMFFIGAALRRRRRIAPFPV